VDGWGGEGGGGGMFASLFGRNKRIKNEIGHAAGHMSSLVLD